MWQSTGDAWYTAADGVRRTRLNNIKALIIPSLLDLAVYIYIQFQNTPPCLEIKH